MRKQIMRALFLANLWFWIIGIGIVVPTVSADPLGGIVVSARVLAMPMPQAGVPVGLKNGSPAVAHSVVITWTPGAVVPGATVAGYNVYRSTTIGGQEGVPALNGSMVVTGTTYTDAAVTNGVTYHYVVAAQSTTGRQSGFSNEAHAPIPSDNNPSNPSGCNTNVQP